MSLKRTAMTSTSLIILAVLFVAVVILANAFLKGARVDLTENKLYTLSDGTNNIVSTVDEPINLYYFFSDQASRDIPAIRTYAQRVQEMLEEFSLRSDGKLRLQIIDPVPFSEEEDQAAQFGLQAIPVGTSGNSLYFGLAGTNSVDGVETIPFFHPDKEAFLEYDLSKLVYNLATPTKPVIGIISSLPFGGGFDPMSRQQQRPWVINDQLRQLFEVRTLTTSLERIAEDIQVLMLIHPKELDDKTLYAIDQFILRGGRAMIFVDPHAETEQPPPGTNPQMAMFAEKSSNLQKLFENWGISVDPLQVVGDARYALAVNINPNQAPVRHVGIMSLNQNALTTDDVITSELSSVNLSMAGFIARQDDAKVDMTPLLTSSPQSMLIGAEQVRFLPDPSELLNSFKPSNENYVLAARLSGKVDSAFPDGAPKNEADEENAENKTDTDTEPMPAHINESAEPINVIVVADTDILSDRLWVRSNNFFGQNIATAWANNGDFVVNAIDNLFGNSDLISMRSRATSNRPFTTVQELERQADAQFRAKEQELEAELRDTEQKLGELQQARDQSTDNMMILTAEQSTEIQKFQERKLEIRKELRQVRRDLDKNIEQLGNWLKFINIGLIPIVLSVLALIVMLFVRSRRRSATA